MVLESIFSASTVERHPRDVMMMAFFVTLVVSFMSYYIFPEYTGIIIPLLVTVSMTPLIYKVFSIEEKIERKQAENIIHRTFLRRHVKTIKILSFFFIGSFLAVFVMMLLLPDDLLSFMFKPQIEAIKAITGYAAYSISGAAIGNTVDTLVMITLNNMRVMAFAFVLSFLFSTGSLFILSWNASILAIYLAAFIRQGLMEDFFSVAVGILPHTPIEIMAYFLGAIAGGMLSVGMIREKWGSKELHLIIKDSAIMLGLSVLAVALGAILETYI